MKNKFSIFLSSLLIISSIFSSCNTEKPPENKTVDIIKDGISNYTVVRGYDAENEEISAASLLCSSIEEKTGAKIEISNDYLPSGSQPDSSTREILVGRTNRPESTQSLQSIGDHGFIIKVVGNKLCIIGTNASMTSLGVYYFIENTLGASPSLSLASDFSYNFTLNGVNIIQGGKSDYTVVRGASASIDELNAATLLRKSIQEKTKADIAISDDMLAAKSREILVGKTNRPQSNTVIKTLSAGQFAIKLSGEELVIAGYDNYLTIKAVEYFVENYLKSDNVSLSPDLNDKVNFAYIPSGADTHKVIESPDLSKLSKLYEKLTPYVADLHLHSNTAPNGDGSSSLAELRSQGERLGIDFMLVADHRETTHVEHKNWDRNYFISGTEPALHLSDKYKTDMHYIIYAPSPDVYKSIMTKFAATYGYNGTTFSYRNMTTKTFNEVFEYVKSVGGTISVCHPEKNDPFYYYYGEGMIFETLYCSTASGKIKDRYNMWAALLLEGKKVYNSAATDTHSTASMTVLNTVYAELKTDTSVVQNVVKGLFVAGRADIRMCIGDTMMGQTAKYTGSGQKLSVQINSIDECNESQCRIRVYTDRGVAYEKVITKGKFSFELEVLDREFYRVEIASTNGSSVYALSQPIWLD